MHIWFARALRRRSSCGLQRSEHERSNGRDDGRGVGGHGGGAREDLGGLGEAQFFDSRDIGGNVVALYDAGHVEAGEACGLLGSLGQIELAIPVVSIQGALRVVEVLDLGCIRHVHCFVPTGQEVGAAIHLVQ